MKSFQFYKKNIVNTLFQNQIFTASLGICSALSVTTQVDNAFIMTIGVCIIAGSSSFLVSLLRYKIPPSVRVLSQIICISTFCGLLEQFLKAFLFSYYKHIAMYISLIATNCIVLGRCESFGMNNKPIDALKDGISSGIGYGFAIIGVSLFREILGKGSLFGYQIFPDKLYMGPDNLQGLQHISLMMLPSGAFFVLGIMIMICKNKNHKT